MKRFPITAAVVLSFLVFCPEARSIHEEIPAETQIALPGPDALKLYDYIVKLRPYEGWHLWPGKGKLSETKTPHGPLSTVYLNDSAYFGIRNNSEMEDGSILILESYSPDKRLSKLSVMYRIKGYNREGGDWFWAEYDPFGKTLASGKVGQCISCHGERGAKDYIR